MPRADVMPRRHSADDDDTEFCCFDEDEEVERSSSGSAATEIGAFDDTAVTARDSAYESHSVLKSSVRFADHSDAASMAALADIDAR